MKKNFNLIIAVLSILGLIVSIYLTYLHFAGSQAAFCSEGSDCDLVRQSSYSSLLGIPVAAYGVLGYVVLLVFSLMSIPRNIRWLVLYAVSLSGFVFSVYLTYLELFVIKAICPYCIVSAVIMTIIFIMLITTKASQSPKLSVAKTMALTALLSAGVLVGSYALQLDSIDYDLNTEEMSKIDEYRFGLAKHLRNTGALMFASFKCPHCNHQKELFGPAMEYILYVECHPKGENSSASLCFSRGITNYPTWEINGRYYEGQKSLKELADLSGFDASAILNKK